jgi:hypothetical protein
MNTADLQYAPLASWNELTGTFDLAHVALGRVTSGGRTFLTVHVKGETRDPFYAAEVGSPQAKELEDQFGPDAADKGWVEYYRYVARTGKDPLDQFPDNPEQLRTRATLAARNLYKLLDQRQAEQYAEREAKATRTAQYVYKTAKGEHQVTDTFALYKDETFVCAYYPDGTRSTVS